MPLDEEDFAEYQLLEEAYYTLLREENPDAPKHAYTYRDGQRYLIEDFHNRLKVTIDKLKQAAAILDIKKHLQNQADSLSALKDLGLLLTPSLIQKNEIKSLIKQHEAQLLDLNSVQAQFTPFNKTLPLLISNDNLNAELCTLNQQFDEKTEELNNLALPEIVSQLSDETKNHYTLIFNEALNKEELIQTVLDRITQNNSWLGIQWLWNWTANIQESTALGKQYSFYCYLFSKDQLTKKMGELNCAIKQLEALTPAKNDDTDDDDQAQVLQQAATHLKAYYPQENFDTLNAVDLYLRIMQAQSSLSDRTHKLNIVIDMLKKFEKENQAIIQLRALYKLTNELHEEEALKQYETKKLADLKSFHTRCTTLLNKFAGEKNNTTSFST